MMNYFSRAVLSALFGANSNWQAANSEKMVLLLWPGAKAQGQKLSTWEKYGRPRFTIFDSALIGMWYLFYYTEKRVFPSTKSCNSSSESAAKRWKAILVCKQLFCRLYNVRPSPCQTNIGSLKRGFCGFIFAEPCAHQNCAWDIILPVTITGHY